MYFYGGAMPELAEGAIGDLLVPASDFVNDYDRVRCERQAREKLLSKGVTLMFRMRQGKAEPKRRGVRQGLETVPPSSGLLVAVTLKEDLFLLLRGTKPARLEPVECTIPALESDAKSLNHAYRLTSEVFEPRRRSHAGNVFQEAFVNNGTVWAELDALRSGIEAKYEHLLHPGGAAQSDLFPEGK